MGSPIIIMTLRPGKGFDARHGARTQDEEGRLNFHFHSFISFNIAHRTIMVLWKARSLTPAQKVEMVEEETDVRESTAEKVEAVEELEAKNLQVAYEENEPNRLQTEESGSFIGIENVNMSMAYSSILSLPLLIRSSRAPEEALMLLVPEAYKNHPTLMIKYPEIVEFYDYYKGQMEAWDGPALLLIQGINKYQSGCHWCIKVI